MLTLSNTSSNNIEDGEMCYKDDANVIPPPTVSLPNCTSTAKYVNLFNERMETSKWSKQPNLQLSEVQVLSDKGKFIDFR